MATTTNTGQKLEENPVLPLDNQRNLVYTLTRIFRLIAQIVNRLVDRVGAFDDAIDGKVDRAGDTMTGSLTLADNSALLIKPANGQDANIVMHKPATPAGMSNQILGYTADHLRWCLAMGGRGAETGANGGSDLE